MVCIAITCYYKYLMDILNGWKKSLSEIYISVYPIMAPHFFFIEIQYKDEFD